MQRLLQAALTFALTAFITAASMALVAAAWLMATHFLQGNDRVPLPK